MVTEQIRTLVEECAAKHAAHVIDLVIRGSRQKSLVEIFIDAEAGVTSDLCSEVSRDVAEMFDANGLMKQSYQLIVSSPGIERPLQFPWQYTKHIGRTLKITVRKEAGVEEVSGKLLAVEPENVVVESGPESQTISFETIHEAIVKAPW